MYYVINQFRITKTIFAFDCGVTLKCSIFVNYSLSTFESLIFQLFHFQSPNNIEIKKSMVMNFSCFSFFCFFCNNLIRIE